MRNQYDHIIIGSGLAGLSFALKAAKASAKVAVISKSQLMQTNSWRAQGGLAAVTSKTDSFEKHISDTLTAGDGLCVTDHVTQVIEHAPEQVRELVELGVHFDLESQGHFELAREGGHSQRRILHIDDHTGQALHSHLIQLAKQNPHITLFENLFVSELQSLNDLIVIKAFNSTHAYQFFSPQVILATGGTGKTYLYTSNWSGATGDGIIMAYQFGAKLSNLEFTQFHPTCLYHPMARNFLISEALRGEGGKLLNQKGEYFMEKLHPLKDLAPRDIVSRAIDQEMKSTGSDCVWLDLVHLQSPELKQRFPKIYKKCLELGIDFLKQPIPVVPAAHYMCGGISVDENFQTHIPGLYAIGECCDSGLHGANRLASNSLLECLVSAEVAFRHIQSQYQPHKELPQTKVSVLPKPLNVPAEAHMHITSLWDEVRQLMWHNMGIIRSQKLMKRAERKIKIILEEVCSLQNETPALTYNTAFLELKNITEVSKLMVTAALGRRESRGCHFDQDFPNKKPLTQKSLQQIGRDIEYIEI